MVRQNGRKVNSCGTGFSPRSAWGGASDRDYAGIGFQVAFREAPDFPRHEKTYPAGWGN